MRLFEIHSPSLKQEIETFPFMKKNYSFDSSTLNFEQKTGIKVTQHYKMPEGLSVEEVYRYFSSILGALDRRKIKKSEYSQRLQHIIDSVLQLNPNLQAIANSSAFDNAGSHVLTAALSLFPIDDIRSYVVDGKTGRWYMDNDPERLQQLYEIETLTGAAIEWIMSDKTFDRVYAEVSKKYKKNLPG